MGYECSNLTEESLLGCSNKSSDDAAGERKQEVYGEDFDEPRMKLVNGASWRVGGGWVRK